MAAGSDWAYVIFGALAGHAICTGVAVYVAQSCVSFLLTIYSIGGKAIAGKVSLRTSECPETYPIPTTYISQSLWVVQSPFLSSDLFILLRHCIKYQYCHLQQLH